MPWPPVLSLTGKTSPGAELLLPKGCEVVPLDTALLADVRRVDEEVIGLDRTVDRVYLLSAEAARQGWVLYSDGQPEGYVFAGEKGIMGGESASGRDRALIRFVLARLVDRGVETAYAAVPEPNAEAQRTLLKAGLVHDAVPGLLLTSRPFGKFDRYVIADRGLM